MTEPLPIGEQITFLYTPDINICIPFYEGVLGLQLALDQGGCRIYRIDASHTAYLGMCERAMLRNPDGVIFTFVTPDVDGWYQKVTAGGVVCEHEPRTNHEYGIYHFFVRDPNGYLLEFQRFLNADWDATRQT